MRVLLFLCFTIYLFFIMSFNYSVTARKNPMNKEAAPKFYAMSQYESIMELDEFAEHIATHGSVYTRDIVHGVITKMVDCMKEQLIEGKRIKLGELGTFQLSISGKGADSAEDFNFATNVKMVKPVWTRGSFFYNFKGAKGLDPKLVLTRKETAEALAEKKG